MVPQDESKPMSVVYAEGEYGGWSVVCYADPTPEIVETETRWSQDLLNESGD